MMNYLILFLEELCQMEKKENVIKLGMGLVHSTYYLDSASLCGIKFLKIYGKMSYNALGTFVFIGR